ncbi:MAG TPA: VOC family protein [Actinomycetota bacterium]|jgi:catechol 2,3-dioxygenase-like lactoylglutathione lyase family enzyme|nr:VOC family protein [Actinomycetota bacterium]
MVRAREVRVVLVVEDYEAAARLYRDVFGLEVVMDLEGQGGRGVIFKVPAATLEVVDAAHDRMVDEIEVGSPQGNRLRIAVEVDDLAEGARAVIEAGAEPLAGSIDTPWGDRNQRFRAAGGQQLTLYQAP